MNQNSSELEIGVRLKGQRLRRRMSQRELSRRSGVPNATISQIESGKLNPTVSMLKKILDGVPMSLAAFFGDDDLANDDKVFFSSADLIEITKGGVSYRQVGKNLTNKSVQLLHETYQPGATTGKSPIKHAGEECGLIIRGSLKVTVGAQTRVLHAGEAYYFSSEQPHSFKNDSRETCELVSACTPPTF